MKPFYREFHTVSAELFEFLYDDSVTCGSFGRKGQVMIECSLTVNNLSVFKEANWISSALTNSWKYFDFHSFKMHMWFITHPMTERKGQCGFYLVFVETCRTLPV